LSCVVDVAVILSIRRHPVHPVRRCRASLTLPSSCPSAVILSILSAVAVAVILSAVDVRR